MRRAQLASLSAFFISTHERKQSQVASSDDPNRFPATVLLLGKCPVVWATLHSIWTPPSTTYNAGNVRDTMLHVFNRNVYHKCVWKPTWRRTLNTKMPQWYCSKLQMKSTTGACLSEVSMRQLRLFLTFRDGRGSIVSPQAPYSIFGFPCFQATAAPFLSNH